MKIAVATIAKNESSFIERWTSSAEDADIMIIGDTGSTDGTVDAARGAGAVVHELTVVPWRFDDARNALLSLVPNWVDVIVTLDMDEILTPGWREKLEAAGEADRYLYNYVWSWKEPGVPDVQFTGERCVSRNNWRWQHPVHEALRWTGGNGGPVVADGGFGIHHHPDSSKPRSQYLPLLEQAAKENPNDDRIAHYYARELYFYGDWDAARKEFVRHLQLPTATWPAERAQSMRYLAKMDYHPERWLWAAAAEDMSRRDAFVDLADLYMQQGRTVEAAGAAARALKITRNPGDYMTTAHAYDDQYLMKIIESSRSNS